MTERQDRSAICRTKLDEWRGIVVELRARGTELDGEDRQELDEAVSRLERHIDDGEARLSELDNTDDGAWESAKEHWEAAWNMVEEAFEKDSAAYTSSDD